MGNARRTAVSAVVAQRTEEPVALLARRVHGRETARGIGERVHKDLREVGCGETQQGERDSRDSWATHSATRSAVPAREECTHS